MDDDLTMLDKLLDSGSLEAEELEKFDDMRADLLARRMLRPDARLSAKQRNWASARIETFGVNQPKFSSGLIPLGKPVKHLGHDIPDHARHPLKPPTRRSS